VHELIVGDEDADVGRAGRDRMEEHEVARLQIVELDLLSDLVLLLDIARQRDAVLREHPLRKAAAIEAAVRVAAAVAVRHAAERQRGVDECQDGTGGNGRRGR
jgi:hypothetical protein